MKRECDNFSSDLSALVDGELPPARRAEVEAHVAGCAKCRQRVTELRRLVDGVAALPKVQPESQFLAEVRRKIARGESPKEQTWVDTLFRPAWIKLPLEAMAVAILLVSLNLLIRPMPEERWRPPQLAKNEAAPSQGPGEAEVQADKKVAAVRDERPPSTPVATAPVPAESASAPEPGKAATTTAEAAPAFAQRKSAEQVPAVVAADDGEAKQGGTTSVSRPQLARAMPKVGGIRPRPTPSETLVVRDTASAPARQRIESLAGNLGGRVIEADRMTTQDVLLADLFLIELPQTSLLAFKDALTGSMDDQAITNQFLIERESTLRLTDAIGGKPAGSESNGTVVLEIRILPPVE